MRSVFPPSYRFRYGVCERHLLVGFPLDRIGAYDGLTVTRTSAAWRETPMLFHRDYDVALLAIDLRLSLCHWFGFASKIPARRYQLLGVEVPRNWALERLYLVVLSGSNK